MQLDPLTVIMTVALMLAIVTRGKVVNWVIALVIGFLQNLGRQALAIGLKYGLLPALLALVFVLNNPEASLKVVLALYLVGVAGMYYLLKK